MPIYNLAARTLTRHEAGRVAAPTDDEQFVAYGRELFQDAELRRRFGKSARSYAEETFDIESIADQFGSALESAVAVRAARNG